MADKHRLLTPSEARAYDDKFGKKQDSQGFYENPALDDVITPAEFHKAGSVVEFGCGTGKLAARLLADHLPPRATYLGRDVSPVMVDLAARRLRPFAERAELACTDGAVRLPTSDEAVDRVVCTYVLDILSKEAIKVFLAESRRVLRPDGQLCLASLTEGVAPISRMVSRLWSFVFRLRPALVGGCRPIRLVDRLTRGDWDIGHRSVVTPFGIPSEVLVLQPHLDKET